MEFDEEFEYSWLKNPINIRIIEEVDNADIDGASCYNLDNPNDIFGVSDLSSGSKALMLVNMLDNPKIWGPLFGDNCIDLLMEISKQKDVIVYMKHMLTFPNKESFEGYSLRLHRAYIDHDDYVRDLIEGITEVICNERQQSKYNRE
ncbi:MAG: DUF4869 domain-containing protein [Lachnospiraceae bacterium]|nr:DUF4869 domain-containing protein [Lachnospiraceae bacterium]